MGARHAHEALRDSIIDSSVRMGIVPCYSLGALMGARHSHEAQRDPIIYSSVQMGNSGDI